MMKNWYNDPRLNCLQHKDLTNIMKVEHLLVEENYDLIKKSNYFEQLDLDNYYFWQGGITNIFIGFLFVLKLIEFKIWMAICICSLCVHVGFTCGTHYFIHQMKKLKMYICVIINTRLINLYAYLFVRKYTVLITWVKSQNFISKQHHYNLTNKRSFGIHWKKKMKVTFGKTWNIFENMNVYIKGTSWAIELPSLTTKLTW